MLDVDELVSREEFYSSDCIFIKGSGLFGYRLENNNFIFDSEIHIDEDNLTDIFANFSSEYNDAVYVGGEASSHGSCGFFYKKKNECIDWLLMSSESDPFVNVIFDKGSISFLSSSGYAWVVSNDDILSVKIIKP
ncbi:hypothetical protein [Xenorhabdus bovienii]|uniref:hypothetical protein n=1 Tax=Xenorhabdus bovienii TaxID=40576 RepID=UPI0023B2BA18|nr:hypothetical protein [Xenorhabdus bovienii]MDE9430801.1 hypothetical protein [Xenorhabdus bovienii]MDE9441374.1 hypothetical protein [Xenorhabdus bovienii]MDE9488444.1 hypothetical protein [Xenorhabdus bovienii]MDE9504823.1 hypothetical protein [Xenorhabdus bovienii]MDE9546269.1 hypothetical protein [Xenorhabdus bovienii]